MADRKTWEDRERRWKKEFNRPTRLSKFKIYYCNDSGGCFASETIEAGSQDMAEILARKKHPLQGGSCRVELEKLSIPPHSEDVYDDV